MAKETAKKEEKKETKKEEPMQKKQEKAKETAKEEELQNKIKGLEEKEKDLISILQRLQAEFENYKKRVDREREGLCCYAKADIIKKLLPIIDAFELALKNAQKKEEFVRGIELVYAGFISTLKKEGLKEIETKGKKFDPYLHEVLLSGRSEKEEGTILEELQKGYMLNNLVIRHSKVKVAKNDGKETGENRQAEESGQNS